LNALVRATERPDPEFMDLVVEDDVFEEEVCEEADNWVGSLALVPWIHVTVEKRMEIMMRIMMMRMIMMIILTMRM
jgi:hypothetical protein